MMKKVSKRRIWLFSLVVIFIFILKYPYLNDVCSENDMYYKLLIFYCNNTYINVIWFIPIVLHVLFITNEFYDKLINFDTRYKNRKRYLYEIFKESIIKHLIMSCIAMLLQWAIFLIISGNFLNIMMISVFIKYVFEIYLLEIIIIMLALLINNYLYSYIFSITISLILISMRKLIFLPFITLFHNCSFNLINIIFLIISCLIIIFSYKNLDLGGVKYEIDY